MTKRSINSGPKSRRLKRKEGLKVFLGQAMTSAQNKCLGITDDDMQPMEKTGIGIVGSVLVGVAFQRRNVTTVAITTDHASIGKGSMGKFLHGCLLEIGRYPYFQKAGIALLIQRRCHENLSLFFASSSLFVYCWTDKVNNIKFDDTVQLMGFISLPYGSADAHEHKPDGFVGCSKHCRS